MPDPICISYWCGDDPSGHRCGYCKNPTGSITHGLVTYFLTPKVYKKLIDRGWRRCGNYCYKPTMNKTCCPAYTIRCSVKNVTLSNSQKKVLRSWNKKLGVKPLKNVPMNLKDFFQRLKETEKLKIETVRIGSDKFRKSEETSHKLYQKYQMKVHEDDESDCDMKQWKRFLCNLPKCFKTEGVEEQGGFHQNYYLDGNLVAVGVLDILPNAVSSVYFYYDPSLESLSLGIFSALQEINFTNSLDYEYYYLGYYIHNCQKMKYKAAYKPSQLLCPESLQFVDFTPMVSQKLDANKYSRLGEGDFFMSKQVNTDSGLFFLEGKVMRQGILTQLGVEEEEFKPEGYETFVKLVGEETASSDIALVM